MPGLRRALIALFVVGVLFAGVDLALVLTSNHDDQKVVGAILGPLIGLGFIGTGAFAWWRRPLNRFGLLMTAVGFAWFMGGLIESDNAIVYTIGSYISPLYLVLVVQLVLSFPTGRLETTASPAIVAVADGDAFVPTLQLVYWREQAGHYVTYAGHRVDLPAHGSGRAVAEVERDGTRVGAIIYDAALRDDPSLVRAAAAAAALQLENERLEAELRARVEELQTSRSRLVEVSMFERRRLERDLHDGAQQRLVALSLQLGLARRKLDSDPAIAATMLD